MATGEDRTEDPTPRRREEARRQGQVAFSPDLAGSIVLLAGVLGLMYLGPDMAQGLLTQVRNDLPHLYQSELNLGQASELLTRHFRQGVALLGGFLLVLLLAGVVVTAIQVGFYVSTDRLGPDFEKLNPAAGIFRLFSLASLVKGLLALIRVAVLGLLVYLVIRSRAGVILTLSEGTVAEAAAHSWALTMRLALICAGAFAIVGVVDYVYQRYRFEQSLKMTRQEIKEELRREEGDPLIKARIRQLQRERARRRMLAEVPTSTVVITNPTHLAVALRYQRGVTAAPRVVAKGAGEMAERIKELARRHAIPIIERPPVARVLFRAVEADQEIPVEMFQAIAEVLAFAYRLRGMTIW